MSNCDPTDQSAIGSQGCSFADQGSAVFFFACDCSPWIVDICEDHARTTKDIIFQGDVVIDRNVILDLAAVTDHHAIPNKDVLTE